jgi:hypothetical protein
MFLQPTHAALGPFCRACSSSPSPMFIGSSLVEPCDDDALPLDSTPGSPALSTCISSFDRLADERSALGAIVALSRVRLIECTQVAPVPCHRCRFGTKGEQRNCLDAYQGSLALGRPDAPRQLLVMMMMMMPTSGNSAAAN